MNILILWIKPIDRPNVVQEIIQYPGPMANIRRMKKNIRRVETAIGRGD